MIPDIFGVTPDFIDHAYWQDLNQALRYLALLHISVVTFALSILLARAIIPSLVYTGHAPESARRLSPVFYAVAAAAGIAALVLAVLWFGSLDVVFDIYEHDLY